MIPKWIANLMAQERERTSGPVRTISEESKNRQYAPPTNLASPGYGEIYDSQTRNNLASEVVELNKSRK